jgi:hypothetical protein
MSDFFKYQLARLKADGSFIVKESASTYTFVKGLKSITVKDKGNDRQLYDFLYDL